MAKADLKIAVNLLGRALRYLREGPSTELTEDIQTFLTELVIKQNEPKGQKNQGSLPLNIVTIKPEKPFQVKFVEWFSEAFQDQFKKPYGSSQGDFVQAAQVLKAFSKSDADFEMLKKLVKAGWNDTKPDKSGFSVSLGCQTVTGFCKMVNRIHLAPVKAKTAYEMEQEAKRGMS